ncbi:MAG: DNA/RNA non-specific endonuclease [Bacteroidales bacterium]|nr:DNA/RNA non-specific endonuclease [Bacteroidales bacterium]
MKNLLSVTFLSILLFLSYSCKKDNFKPENIELPAPVGNHQIIEHYAYTLSYNEEHEQADWVAYELTKEEVLNQTYDRTDDFREDPNVTSTSAQLSDYEPTSQSYARGHLAPAADFRWSETAMSESFYMSNMSPMLHEFNSGKWFYLEAEVRNWAEIYDGVYVITGGILKDGLPTIGTSGVSIPEKFYKIILDPDEEKAIAFIMPNEDIRDTFKNYAVTIDKVEEETGLDFFPGLEDKLEEKIESTLNMSKWTFDYYK